MRKCAICGKIPVAGRSMTYRGMLKKKGGVGRKTVRSNLRRFLPNLQQSKVIINGAVMRVKVCTHCLRSGRVKKAPSKPSRHSA